MTAGRILALLDEVTESGDSWPARCPAHDDNSPSLSLRLTEDEKLLMYCHAGCKTEDVMEAIDLPMTALFPTPDSVEYVYLGENGEPLYKVRRYGYPKKFAQSRWDGTEFVSGVKGVRKVPYHLPDLLTGVAEGRTIQIPEGEKDVDRLRSLGMVATCNAGGTGKGNWSEWAAEGMFDGARVVLWPDNDEAGRQHVNKVADALFGHAEAICIAKLPVATKGDVSDYLNEDHDIQDLASLIAAAAPVTEATTPTLTREQTGSTIFVAREVGTAPFYMRRTVSDKGEVSDTPITDFVFDPVATIRVEDPPRIVFVVQVVGNEFQLPSDIFDNAQRLTHWCNSVNLGWSGTSRDLQGILYLLRTANVPEWDGTSIVGLHGDCFVIPEETIGGKGSLVHVPHEFGNTWEGKTSLSKVERSLTTDMWPEHLHDLSGCTRRR